MYVGFKLVPPQTVKIYNLYNVRTTEKSTGFHIITHRFVACLVTTLDLLVGVKGVGKLYSPAHARSWINIYKSRVIPISKVL